MKFYLSLERILDNKLLFIMHLGQANIYLAAEIYISSFDSGLENIEQYGILSYYLGRSFEL